MTEIKFRAWDKKRKRMFAVTTLNASGAVSVFIDDDGLYLLPAEQVELMQYTGIKDKNGKEIYEGDIVENTYEYVGKVRYEVKWDCGRFIMTSKNPYNLVQIGMGIYPNSSKVIGNIHENPELLEGNK